MIMHIDDQWSKQLIDISNNCWELWAKLTTFLHDLFQLPTVIVDFQAQHHSTSELVLFLDLLKYHI